MADAAGIDEHRTGAGRRAGSWAAVAVLAATAVFGANPAGLRERLVGPDAVEPAAARSAEGDDPQRPAPTGDDTVLRSNPWWQELASGAVDAGGGLAFTVAPAALQWRVHWACEQGQLELSSAGGAAPTVSTTCPDSGVTYGTTTGEVELRATGDAPAELAVEQQVDVPLAEPPLDEMVDGSATVLLRGTFEPVDQSTTGEARIHRLPDGRRVLRLEDFFVTPNVDLELRLSTVEDITTSEQYLAGESVHLAALDVTAGSMNIELPPEVDLSGFSSLVVWCEPVLSAYATADLDGEG